MSHLTRSQRDQIEALHRARCTQQEIADIVGCSQPAISRELSRNCSEKQHRYTASTAQVKAESRKVYACTARTEWHEDAELLQHVITELRGGKSPEQIAGRRKHLGLSAVSYETIYTYIRQDKQAGGTLYTYLRYQGKKYKWRGFSKKNTKIPNRRDITERPPEVDAKTRHGDWESDLVVSGKDGSGAAATYALRRCLLFRAILVESKSADEMLRASVTALKPISSELRLTMTHDNGTEIAQHEKITQSLDAMPVYCARPYHSWERGLNEWYNRELRRFFPKGTDFSKHAQADIDIAVDWLNNCPRKTLGYRTPNEVYAELVREYAFHA